MNKYVALLRGINVGGNNKIAMANLKACFESLGFKNVSTYINSGNVMFDTKVQDTKTIISDIERAIRKTFKLDIRIVLRTRENILKVCKKIPDAWMNDKEYKTDVMFLWDEYRDEKTLELLSTNAEIDSLLYVDGAIIWHLKKKDYSKSGMRKLIGTDVYKQMTVRNINTVRKLATLMA